MNVITAAYIPFYLNPEKLDSLIDQLLVTIHSYFIQGNTWEYIVFTNNEVVEATIKKYSDAFKNNVHVQLIDFEKEWNALKLPINSWDSFSQSIISKLLIPFIFKGDYLIVDWDILFTGMITEEFITSDKIRFFRAKLCNNPFSLNCVSTNKGFIPNPGVGNFNWVNSGFYYVPTGILPDLLKENWHIYTSLDANQRTYKDIWLYNNFSDEVLLNLIRINGCQKMEEFEGQNINISLYELDYKFKDIDSIYCFGKKPPNILTIHFHGGGLKPTDVTLYENYISINLKVSTDKELTDWFFKSHPLSLRSTLYNYVMFAVVWHYIKYQVKETINDEKPKMSLIYKEYFDKEFISK